MPRTKSKPKTPSQPTSPEMNGPVADVLTLAEAAAYLRVGEQDVLRLIHEQSLPARQVGTDWRFLKPAIQDWLRTGTMPPGNEAWLEMAGAFKDDPFLEQIVEEAYRQRGRPITEDGSYKNFSR